MTGWSSLSFGREWQAISRWKRSCSCTLQRKETIDEPQNSTQLRSSAFFLAKSVTRVKTKKTKKKGEKKYIGVPRGNLGLESIKGRDPFVCAPHSHSSARRANIFFAFSSWLARLTSLKRKDCLLSKFFTIILNLTNSMTNQENTIFFSLPVLIDTFKIFSFLH